MKTENIAAPSFEEIQMPTPSPKLGLALPAQPDDFSTADLRANWEKIDAAPGSYICTSTTLPSWGANQAGRKIIETNTGVERMWTGTAWRALSPEPGDLKPSARTTPDDGWLLCDGRTLNRSTYSALFAAIGTAYNTGTVAATDFKIPDLRKRVIGGRDTTAGATTFQTLGKVEGEASVRLTTANLPPHTHTMNHKHDLFTSGGQNRDHSHTGRTGEGKALGNIVVVGTVGGLLAPNHFTGYNPGASYSQWDGLAIPGGNHFHDVVTGGASQGHEHEINVPGFAGSTGAGPGTSTSFSVIQPTLTMNYFIKY